MRKFILILLIIFFATVIVCTATTEAAPSRLAFGAASPGGSFYIGAVSLATVINEKIEDVDCIVEQTNATVHNIRLTEAGEIHLGMASSNVLWEAWNGEMTFEGEQTKNIRLLIPGWPGVNMFVTLERHGINSVLDFEGTSFSLGPRGGAAHLFSERAFEIAGVTVKGTNLATTDASRALTDGMIKGFCIQWPATVVHELEVSHDLKLLTVGEHSMTTKQVQEFNKVYPMYSEITIPKGFYKAITEDMPSAGQLNSVIGQKDLSEDLVYRIVKEIYENKEMIGKVFPAAARGIDLDNIIYSTVENVPYHPGAIKYFQEQGVIFPDNLIPPEMK